MKKIKAYIILHSILLLNSLNGIFSKLAAGKDFLSPGWIFFYGLVIIGLGIYALLWSQVLKSVPLNVAYANKAVSLIWGMIWGTVIFNEAVTVRNIIGAVLVLTGVIIMVTGGEKQNE